MKECNHIYKNKEFCPDCEIKKLLQQSDEIEKKIKQNKFVKAIYGKNKTKE